MWGVGSGKWREGKVFKEMKRGGDSLGRKDTAAVWTEKSIQTLKDLVQHNTQCLLNTLASVVPGNSGR